jgi:NIPSNAP
MIHELRVFHSIPGRLPALLKRFEYYTLQLFEKHGIKPLGLWTVAIGECNNDLYLMLEWQSLAEREQKFAAFLNDPDLIEVRRKSEENGPLESSITNTILLPTTFSTVGQNHFNTPEKTY